jgi:hypothetical protein
VACYTSGNPTATCGAPDHCCFDDYSSSHNGYCTTDTCFYGTISCDGPEDCNTGEVCCARALSDPDNGTYGYNVSCQAGPCTTTPLVHEICHAGATTAGTCSDPSATCAPALGNDNDLPRALAICL